MITTSMVFIFVVMAPVLPGGDQADRRGRQAGARGLLTWPIAGTSSRLFRLREQGRPVDREQAEKKGLNDDLSRVMVPTEEVVEVRRGKGQTGSASSFPATCW